MSVMLACRLPADVYEWVLRRPILGFGRCSNRVLNNNPQAALQESMHVGGCENVAAAIPLPER